MLWYRNIIRPLNPFTMTTTQLGLMPHRSWVIAQYSEDFCPPCRRTRTAGNRAAHRCFLAVDTDPPYVDTRPLAVAGKPVVREYQARYLDGDDEVGLPSDIVKAVARP
jgi:hypothetical protein